MSNFLIRGIPSRLQRQIQQWADKENLSVNQLFIRLVREAIGSRKKMEEEEEKKKDVFQRIEELREKIYRRHGLLDDSTKLIREDRDNH